MAKVTVLGASPSQLARDVQRNIDKIPKKLYEIGLKIEQQLKQQIRTNTKRRGSNGELIASITTTVIPSLNNPAVGVGNIDLMFAQAPYWFVVNYGKVSASRDPASLIAGNTGRAYIPPVTRGSFAGSPSAPQGGTGENQQWNNRSNGRYFLIPGKSIRPMNYIEKTGAWLVTYWDSVWN